MRRQAILAWAVVFGASVGVARGSDVTGEAPSADVKAAAGAGNRFAVKLYDAVRRPGENGAVGPMCVSNALTLLAVGAKGETREGMVKTLGWEGVDVGGGWGRLVGTVNRAGQGVELRSAAGVWVREGAQVRPAFERVARERFGAEMGAWDPREPAAGAAKINAWAERNTNGRIREIVDPGVMVDGEAVIGSTTYFKGKWRRPFEEKETREEAFRVDDKRSVQVKMMHRSLHDALYGETKTYQALWLPYVGYAVSMVVVLPKGVDGLEGVEREIVAGGVESVARPTGDEVTAAVSLPRFAVRGRYALSEVFAGMGMEKAFGRDADFSGMVVGRPVRVTSVVHEAVVEVNEEGTEAAAGTGIAVGALSDGPRYVTFKADHPFLFMIVHERTGAVLFMGRIVDPTAGK